jgi:hypothetical protein
LFGFSPKFPSAYIVVSHTSSFSEPELEVLATGEPVEGARCFGGEKSGKQQLNAAECDLSSVPVTRPVETTVTFDSGPSIQGC